MKKKLFSLLLAVVIVVVGCGIGVFNINRNKLKVRARNNIVGKINLNDFNRQSKTGNSVITDDNYVFTLNRSTGEFSVFDTKNNYIWYSTPQNADEDKTANELGKQWLHSQLIVKYYNDKDNLIEITSQAACVNKGGLQVYESADKICCVYRFVKEKFDIPVVYSFTEDGLSVTIPFDNIKEKENNKVSSIMLLPYFGAIGEQSEGYLFLPDGSGAVIQLTSQNNELKNLSYEKMIYGRDNALSIKVQPTNQQDLIFPVYAACSGGGMITTVTEGDAITSFKVYGEGYYTGYSSVIPVCTVRARDTIVLYENTVNEVTSNVYQKNIGYRGNFSVCYHFMNNEFSYSDIANYTAEYYQRQMNHTAVNTGKLKLYLQTVGVTQKLENHFGIPLYYDYSLTTAEDAIKYIEKLNKCGVDNTMLLYYGMFDKGDYNITPIGGKLNKLISSEKLNSSDATIVPMLDLIRIYKSGNGVSLSENVCKGIQGTKLTVSPISINTGKMDMQGNNYSILRSDYLYDAYDKTQKNILKYGFSDFGDMGINVLASSLSKQNEISRQDAFNYYCEVMKKTSKMFNKSVTESFYGYQLPYITDTVDLPICSSMLSCFTYDVPFAQLVVSKYLDYSSTPLNEVTTDKKAIMKMLEYRVCPSYRLIKSDLTELVDTYMENKPVGNFDDYFDEIVENYKAFSEFYKKAGGSLVNSKRIASGVFMSEYSNGAKVIFNYNDTPFVFEDTSVPSESYVFLG